jgi:soluble lytic murein transglycosylase-like protein
VLLLCCVGLWLSGASPAVSAQSTLSAPAVTLRAQRLAPLIEQAAQRHGIEPRWLWVLAWLETRFVPQRVSPKGARGLLQFMPHTAARYGLRDPHNPAAALDAAARYLCDLARRFDGEPALILAAYNAGEGTVEAYRTGRPLRVGNKWLNRRGRRTNGVPPYPETRRYVAEGLRLLPRLPLAAWQAPAQQLTRQRRIPSAPTPQARSTHARATRQSPPAAAPPSLPVAARRSLYYAVPLP